MVPKAYRWVGEMEEIADFVDSGLSSSSSSASHIDNVKENANMNGKENTPGEIYRGLAALYSHVESELTRNGRETGGVHTLLDFAREAKRVSDSSSNSK